MKSSCIRHPEKEPLIIIRKWQLDFCEGNKVAAALISFFEYWHNIKLEQLKDSKKMNHVAMMHGEEGNHPEHTFQYHTLDDLENGILGIGKRTKIKEARELLRKMGVISEHRNPNEKYRFDQTIYYQFHPKTCEKYISSRMVRNDPSRVKNDQWPVENVPSVVENDRTITETTTKTKHTKSESERVARTVPKKVKKNPSTLNDHSSSSSGEGSAGGGAVSPDPAVAIKEKVLSNQQQIETWKMRYKVNGDLPKLAENFADWFIAKSCDGMGDREIESWADRTGSIVFRKAFETSWLKNLKKFKNTETPSSKVLPKSNSQYV